MTAAVPSPTPAPVHQADHRQVVVRIRFRESHPITSPGMPLPEAEQLRDDLRVQIAGIGGAYGFVAFTGREGRSFEVRAREVLALEITAEGDPRARHHQPGAAEGGVVIQVHGDIPPTNGTSWLQQRAGHHRVPLEDPR